MVAALPVNLTRIEKTTEMPNLEGKLKSLWEWVLRERALGFPNMVSVEVLRDGGLFAEYRFASLDLARSWLKEGGLQKLQDGQKRGGGETWTRLGENFVPLATPGDLQAEL